jgi:3,4-dihydroxy 2-butanone 4-phosphate synthase/GTP cyclohydrolase II
MGQISGHHLPRYSSSCIHIALIHGKPSEAQETLVRVHEPVTVLDF